MSYTSQFMTGLVIVLVVSSIFYGEYRGGTYVRNKHLENPNYKPFWDDPNGATHLIVMMVFFLGGVALLVSGIYGLTR